MYCKAQTWPLPRRRICLAMGTVVLKLKVVFVSFNDDDDDDDDKGARLCGDAMMMRGQKRKRKER